MLEHQVKTRGVIVGFEGLQPYSGHRIDNLTRHVAEDLDLVHVATSGNPSAHLLLLKAAHANGQPIYIVGYSAGGGDARRLAEKCRQKNIPVDGLFLLDPGTMGVFTGKIPRNVRKVVFYQSGTYPSALPERPPRQYLEDPANTSAKFMDLIELNHMSLPMHLARSIEAEIKKAP